jgi:hypothetical protein
MKTFEIVGENYVLASEAYEVINRLEAEIKTLKSGDVSIPKPTEPQCLYDQHGGDLEDELALS